MIAANKEGNILNLRIYGFIGRGWFADASAEEINRELEKYGKVGEIHVRIHSPGGSIAEGCAIYNSLKNNPAKKKVFIEGECASIATVVAMAGDEIVMSPVAEFMIHNPFISYISGGAEELRQNAEALDTLKEVMINAYSTKTHLSREEISEYMNKETYFTADEALKCGFITEVLEIGALNAKTGIGKYNYQRIPDNFFNLKKDNKNIQEEKMEIKDVTLEQLKAENPELFKAVKTEGATEERERIKKWDVWAKKTVGAEEIIEKYKYAEPKNSADMTEELLDYVGKKEIKAEKGKVEEKGLLDNFEAKKKDYEASGVEALGNVTSEEIKAEKEKQDIQEIIEIANKNKL